MLLRISIILGLTIGIAIAALVYRSDSADSLLSVASFMDEESRPELFSTLHEVMPSSPILASTRPRMLHRLPGSFDAGYTWQGKEKSLDDFFQETRAMGLIVLRDGGILEERYGPGFNQDTPISIWTATGSYLSTLAGIAIEQGLIESLDDPVEKYAGSFKGTEYGGIPIRNLLNGNSNMDFTPGVDLPIPDHLETYLDLIVFPDDLDEMARSMRSQAVPEPRLGPIPTDLYVLSAVIQGAWGNDRSLVEILHDEFWEPMGFGGNAFWAVGPESPDGQVLVRCCLSMRLREFAQLGQIYLEDGSFRGEQYLPSGWTDISSSLEPQPDGQTEIGTDPGYESGFWIPASAEGEFMARGSFGQSLWIDRAHQVVIAQFSAGDGSDDVGLDERIKAYRAIARTARTSPPFLRGEPSDPASHSEDSAPNP